jgi:ABC-type transporter Mla subunit MlaD
MKSFRRSVAVFSLGFGLMMSGAVSLPAMAGNSAFQEYGNNSGDIRGLVDRTQADLRAAGDIQHGQKERERYKHAQKSLSTFDRHLAKGQFDKDKLDDAISDIQSVLDHNTLQASSRDALVRDVADLRAARAQR